MPSSRRGQALGALEPETGYSRKSSGKENLQKPQNHQAYVEDEYLSNLYNKAKSFTESSDKLMGSKERGYYQDEIMRLSKELEEERSQLNKSSWIQGEFERSMKICLEQENDIEALGH